MDSDSSNDEEWELISTDSGSTNSQKSNNSSLPVNNEQEIIDDVYFNSDIIYPDHNLELSPQKLQQHESLSLQKQSPSTPLNISDPLSNLAPGLTRSKSVNGLVQAGGGDGPIIINGNKIEQNDDASLTAVYNPHTSMLESFIQVGLDDIPGEETLKETVKEAIQEVEEKCDKVGEQVMQKIAIVEEIGSQGVNIESKSAQIETATVENVVTVEAIEASTIVEPGVEATQTPVINAVEVVVNEVIEVVYIEPVAIEEIQTQTETGHKTQQNLEILPDVKDQEGCMVNVGAEQGSVIVSEMITNEVEKENKLQEVPFTVSIEDDVFVDCEEFQHISLEVERDIEPNPPLEDEVVGILEKIAEIKAEGIPEIEKIEPNGEINVVNVSIPGTQACEEPIEGWTEEKTEKIEEQLELTPAIEGVQIQIATQRQSEQPIQHSDEQPTAETIVEQINGPEKIQEEIEEELQKGIQEPIGVQIGDDRNAPIVLEETKEGRIIDDDIKTNDESFSSNSSNSHNSMLESFIQIDFDDIPDDFEETIEETIDETIEKEQIAAVEESNSENKIVTQNDPYSDSILNNDASVSGPDDINTNPPAETDQIESVFTETATVEQLGDVETVDAKLVEPIDQSNDSTMIDTSSELTSESAGENPAVEAIERKTEMKPIIEEQIETNVEDQIEEVQLLIQDGHSVETIEFVEAPIEEQIEERKNDEKLIISHKLTGLKNHIKFLEKSIKEVDTILKQPCAPGMDPIQNVIKDYKNNLQDKLIDCKGIYDEAVTNP